MSILTANNVSKHYGTRALLDGVSFDVQAGQHVGLVGVNGAGKTSLFKMITGELSVDSGHLHVDKNTVLGYMQQHVTNSLDDSVYTEAESVFAELVRMEAKLEDIARQLRAGGDEAALTTLVGQQDRVTRQYEDGGGYTFRSRTRAMLLGLGFTPRQLELPVRALSGGQRSKLLLAKMLLTGADLLLLDEPTNHLDITAITWLEDYLRGFSGSYIIISHDRYFLDRTTQRTLVIECGHIQDYRCNYSGCLERRATEQDVQQRHYKNQLKEIRRLEGIIVQQRRWNREKNIRTAESKQKVVDKLKAELEPPRRDLSGIRLAFAPSTVSGEDVLTVENVCKSFPGGKTLFSDVSLELKRGERVFLLGPNGCGKTTLLKIIMGDTAADAGRVIWGQQVKRAYYDQTQESLDLSRTVLEEIHQHFPFLTGTQARGALAAFLFKGDDVFKENASLSGGERARVQLLKLMLKQANFLLLDEPTNHLDIDSREAFEAALEDYEGTLFVVSHDRYLINRMADRVLYFGEAGLMECIGGYDDYLEMLEQRRLRAQAATQQQTHPAKGNNAYQEQKQQRRAAAALAKAERDIQAKEEQIQALQGKLEACTSDYEQLLEVTAALETARGQLDALYEKWEQLQ